MVFIDNVSPAETLPIEAESAQLLTACQAVHWFDLENFFKEVNRVLSNNGVIALFGYTMPDISHKNLHNKRIKDLCKKFYRSPLLVWSKKERQLVDEQLASISLPFANQVRRNDFETVNTASAEELKGYLLSWSGFNTLRDNDKESAKIFLESFDNEIKEIFGDQPFNQIQLNIHYQFYLLMARKI